MNVLDVVFVLCEYDIEALPNINSIPINQIEGVNLDISKLNFEADLIDYFEIKEKKCSATEVFVEPRSHMIPTANESDVGWKFIVSSPKKLNGIGWSWMQKKDICRYKGGLNICMSSNNSFDGVVIEFAKQSHVTGKDFEAQNQICFSSRE
ncbi:hypothetical protein LIER_14745 [Lithospermum erythrorhizon]|uniref:Uncharacterized protein n=1 Tax=Lithospermum erythrorhizon TaxID=34254 RepID=A0AAV3Q086_LITER